ncbi:SdpI family protein [Acidithiobacillus sulfurivorans]|uniref:DUF1648 domain-containing protein n=1 Tax=Acidithiobacillus sulfurivorans TaxID=1958756 RepID=A0ABS6A2V7_9PROT|nr:SdpI family protein [Acidithiobacillus sulfurivorans]MBU2761269.1 DUF1648 domain-containing protein [Acidithiobacillus sulfurivorans]
MKFPSLSFANVIFVVASWGLVFIFYNHLPNPVPIHWNSSDHINGAMDKPWGALWVPLTVTVLWVFLYLLPIISPRGFRMDSFIKTWRIIITMILGCTFLVETIALLKASGFPVNLAQVIPIIIGVLFIWLSNFMGKLRKNFFVGIRTPWTLSNDTAWFKTHRLGAWFLAMSGLTFIGEGVRVLPLWVPQIVLAIFIIILIGYSYLVAKKNEAEPPEMIP